MSKKYISFSGELHGFAHQASSERYGEFEALPESSVGAVITSLRDKRAEKGLMAARDDKNTLSRDTLEALVRDGEMKIVGEANTRVRHVLAVPEVQIRELVQSGFPGSIGHRGAEGRQLSEADQRAYRNRLDTIFVTEETGNMCDRTLQQIGVDLKKLPSTPGGEEPARAVLRRAREELDPNRTMQTTETASGQMQRQSTLSAQAHKKGLFGVVVPFDVARSMDDYIIIQDRMDDDTDLDARFYLVERAEAPKKKKGRSMEDSPSIQARRKIKEIVEEDRAARMIVKIDDAGVPSLLSALKKEKAANRLDFEYSQLPGVSGKPSVFEILWTAPPRKDLIRNMFSARNDANVLGVYAATVDAPISQDEGEGGPRLWVIGGLGLAAAAAAAFVVLA